MLNRAILFDLDGTLLLDRRSAAELFLAYCGRLGQPLNGGTAARLERWQLEYWSHHDELEHRLAQSGREQFWLDYSVHQMQFLGIQGPLDDYAQKIDAWFREEYVFEPLVPDDVRPTLTGLRQAGAVLGLVSNRSTPLGEVAAEHNLADLFDFTLSAGEAGAWKPNPDIFHKALALAGAAPETAVYVGDNYYADVVGARNAGLTGILIDRRGIFPDIADCRVIKAIGELAAQPAPTFF